ncbi:MAG: 30S ribosomal protein S12 methylthiotransferase RimO [Oligoflexia bacterium]|nr:30S ribosomal protein S12 methylthiotransferase RimO [Oligoflexia bacterium]
MKKIFFLNLGCPRNQKDGETALALLLPGGFVITEDPGEADLLLVNTCAFIDDAKEESVSEIIRLSSYKENRPDKPMFVMGCLSQHYANELMKELPEVDVFIGTSVFNKIKDIYVRFLDDGKRASYVSAPGLVEEPCDYDILYSNGYIPETGRYSAYLKISEGCNNRCSYCVIPSIRGNLKYRSTEAIINEVKRQVNRGIKEFVFIAQDLTADPVFLSRLLRQILKSPRNSAPEWIRLMYCNPWGIDDELLKIINNEEKILKYIDMPIQHISNNVLRAMNRKAGTSRIKAVVDKLVKYGITIRTTVMTGFPGETDRDYQLLHDYISQGYFHWMGVFAYSEQEGTDAINMPRKVPAKLALERRNELDRIQFDITNLINNGHIGKTYPALLERLDGEKWNARFYFQAPAVDGIVSFSGDPTDGFVKVTVEDTNGIDLFGRLAD